MTAGSSMRGPATRRPTVNSPLVVSLSLAFAVAATAIVQTMSVPLLPVMPDVFGVSIAAASWIATTTLLVGAVSNPVVGRLGDVRGKWEVMLGCLGLTLVGLIISATATSFVVFVAGRTVQGLGAGVIALAYGIARDAVPASMLPRSLAAVTAGGIVVGAGLGPVAMGAVLEVAGWRAVSWATAVLVAVALAAVRRWARAPSARSAAKFDLVGATLLGVTLVVVLIAVTQAPGWGWRSPAVALSLTVGACAGASWVFWVRRHPDPIVDLRVSMTGDVRRAHVGGVLVGFSTFVQFIVTFTLVALPSADGVLGSGSDSATAGSVGVAGLGRSATVAGLIQLPGVAALAVTMLAASSSGVVRRPRELLAAGAGVVAAGFALGALRHSSVLDVIVSVMVVNAGIGATFTALPLLIVRSVRADQTGSVNAVNGLARIVGSVTASAVVSVVLATGAVVVSGRQYPVDEGFTVAYSLAAALALTVSAVALSGSRIRPSVRRSDEQ